MFEVPEMFPVSHHDWPVAAWNTYIDKRTLVSYMLLRSCQEKTNCENIHVFGAWTCAQHSTTLSAFTKETHDKGMCLFVSDNEKGIQIIDVAALRVCFKSRYSSKHRSQS